MRKEDLQLLVMALIICFVVPFLAFKVVTGLERSAETECKHNSIIEFTEDENAYIYTEEDRLD